MIKLVLKSYVMITVLGFISGMYFILLAHSIRWRQLEGEGLTGKLDPSQGGIITFWHSRFLGFPHSICWQLRPFTMTSPSRDGRTMALVSMMNGARIVYGSSSKGGVAAYVKLRRLLKSKVYLIITPDGPRGPARQATASAIHLSAASGLPIIPFSYSVSPVTRAQSWDRLMIPKWFGRGVYAFGSPIYIKSKPSKAEIETARLALEDAINVITARVDAEFNYPPDHIPNRYGNSK